MVDMLATLPDILDMGHPVKGQLNTNVVDVCIVGFYWLMQPSKTLGAPPAMMISADRPDSNPSNYKKFSSSFAEKSTMPAWCLRMTCWQ